MTFWLECGHCPGFSEVAGKAKALGVAVGGPKDGVHGRLSQAWNRGPKPDVSLASGTWEPGLIKATTTILVPRHLAFENLRGLET